jgi:exosortase
LLWLAPLLFLWQGLIRHLSVEWTLNPQYRYGWAMPFLCVYLLWRNQSKKPKPSLEWNSENKGCLNRLNRHRVTCAACLVLGFGLAAAYAPTRLIQEANPEWRLVSWALAIEVVGLTILALHFFLRFRHSSSFPLSCFSLSALPVLFFLLSVPWPTVIESPLIRSLTSATAQGTAEILGLLGIPAVVHGNVIETGHGLLGIEDACSGIRSFQASLMIAIFFGEVYQLSLPSRIPCVIGGLLFALCFNLGRTTLLALIVATKGSIALAAWHDSAGLTILLSCFAATWLLAFCFRKLKKPTQVGMARCAVPARVQRAERILKDVRITAHVVPLNAAPDGAARHPYPGVVSRCPTAWRMSLALTCWIAFVEIGTELWYRSHEEALANPIRWRVEPPRDSPGVRDLGLSETSRQFLRFDEGLNATWQDPTGLRWQAIFLRWEPSRVAPRLARNHTPEDCLIAAGHELAANPALHVISVHGLNLPFRFYVANDQGDPFHIFYCLWEDRAPQQSFDAEWLSYRNRLIPVLSGRRHSGQRSLELALWGAANERDAEDAVRIILPTIIKVEN